jgi:hypothetical protein
MDPSHMTSTHRHRDNARCSDQNSSISSSDNEVHRHPSSSNSRSDPRPSILTMLQLCLLRRAMLQLHSLTHVLLLPSPLMMLPRHPLRAILRRWIFPRLRSVSVR